MGSDVDWKEIYNFLNMDIANECKAILALIDGAGDYIGFQVVDNETNILAAFENDNHIIITWDKDFDTTVRNKIMSVL